MDIMDLGKTIKKIRRLYVITDILISLLISIETRSVFLTLVFYTLFGFLMELVIMNEIFYYKEMEKRKGEVII
jgi:hypothetical protein